MNTDNEMINVFDENGEIQHEEEITKEQPKETGEKEVLITNPLDNLSEEEKAQEEAVARATGWTEKSKYTAREHNFRTPLYNRIANLNKKVDKVAQEKEQQEQLSAAELKNLKELLETQAAYTKKAQQDAYEQARLEFEALKYKAVEDGDLETFKKLEKQEKQPTGQPKVLEEFNQRYQHIFAGTSATDIKAADYMQFLYTSAEKRGFTPEKCIEIVEDGLKTDFPAYFKENNAIAAEKDDNIDQVVEKNTNSAYYRDPSKDKPKTFDDIPTAQQATIKDLCKRHGLDKEQYAKSYWSALSGVENVFDDD